MVGPFNPQTPHLLTLREVCMSETKQQLMASAMELARRNHLEVVEDRGFTICKDGGRKRLMWSADINELMVALIAIDWYRND